MGIAIFLPELRELHSVALVAPVARRLLDLDREQIVIVGTRHMHDDVRKHFVIG